MELTTEYNFIVRQTTVAENLALQAFSKANNYACSNISRTGKNYKESDLNSYERFLDNSQTASLLIMRVIIWDTRMLKVYQIRKTFQ